MQSLLILGRQPELGLAELESLYGSDKLTLLQKQAVLIDVDPCLLAFKRLGGSLKFAKLLTTLDSTNWEDIEKFLSESAPEHSKTMPAGKMTFGLSVYGFDINPQTISKSALNIKRAIQKTGRSVRIVPNKSPELNTAQVIHNKLTNERSWELLIVKSDAKTYIAQTVMVQDIDAYSKRDQARPNRDSRVGMLPPKLAQIIINLAVGELDESTLESICENLETRKDIKKLNQTVLDPFCGSGVMLQEAFLMGYDVIGSDQDPRMVEYTKSNLKWIAEQYRTTIDTGNVNTGDARNKNWPKFNFVASETNLGKPITSIPSRSELDNMVNDLNKLITAFLINVSKQTEPGTRICLAIPAWQVSKNNFKTLPLIDQIADLGYNSIDFKQTKSRELIYYRPDQLVGRQLLTLVRK
ncbi:MAG: hypothetical protein WDN66_00865 [Candidatus Saccharibacteria bacterium]